MLVRRQTRQTSDHRDIQSVLVLLSGREASQAVPVLCLVGQQLTVVDHLHAALRHSIV